MNNSNLVRVVIGLVGLSAIAFLGVRYAMKQAASRVSDTSGTIIAIDPVARTGEVEIIHPKSGRPVKIAGKVADDCDIRVNGTAATLADVHVGDKVKVTGTVQKHRSLLATRIYVLRDETQAVQSAQSAPPPTPTDETADQTAPTTTAPAAP